MKRIALGVMLLFFAITIKSEEAPEVKYPSLKVDGMFKGKYEYAVSADKSRFTVRSSRIGVWGYINKYFSYRGLIELSEHGKLRPLDVYANFIPNEKFTISLGQRTIPLFNGYTVIPSEIMFSSRPFLGKYLMGTRDFGMLGKYVFNISQIPSSVEFGVYNGNSIEAPSWHGKPSFGGRFAIGNMRGWRSTVKFYEHDNSVNENIKYQIYGADIRYEDDRWRTEAEIMKRKDRDNGEGDVYAFYIQGAYIHPLNYGLVKNFIPALRFDGIEHDKNVMFDANRLTLGLGFGLSPKYLSSIFRIDYEHFFINNESDAIMSDKIVTSNKVTFELLLKF